MIVVLPSDTPVTSPSTTVAMSSSVDAHVTSAVTQAGASVAVRVTELPTLTVAVAGVTVIPVSEGVGGVI